MKVTLKTAKLKEMVSRAVKGVGNNKLIPITGLMSVGLKDGELTIITTDGTNYLYVKANKIVGDNFNVTVSADVFSKLISKMTSEDVTFDFRPDITMLEITGNGKYRIELPLDEDGQLIKYPDPVEKLGFDSDKYDTTVLNRSTVQVILETLKSALAVTMENPCYTGYYVGDQVVATDTYKIASMGVKIFDSPRLLSPEFMNLLGVINTEKINVSIMGDKIVCSTPDCTVYGVVMDCIDEYSIDAISGLLDTEFDSFCSIPKTAFVQLLDRLSLFVGAYDKNEIRLTFTRDGLHVSSKASTGVEIIKYISSENFIDYTCTIDIEMLMQEVKAIQSDVIELHYGTDNAIKLVDGNITIIVALLEEEE